VPDAPPGAEPQIAALLAANAELRKMNAAMAARLALLEAPPERWMPLKAAASLAGVPKETARRRAIDGSITAKRVRSRWYVDFNSLRAWKQLASAKPEPFGRRPTGALGDVSEPSVHPKRREIGSVIRSRLGRLETRPTPVFFVPACALLARVVQQPLRDLLPDGVTTVEPDRVGGLDFHCAFAPATGDAQHVALDLRKPSLPHLGVIGGSARVFKQRFPIFRGQRFVRSRSGDRRPPGGFGGQFFHPFGCRHAPARGSVGHDPIRT
jgi:hypothetical protein